MAARTLRPLIRCQTLQRALRLGVLSALLAPGTVWAQLTGIVPLTASPGATSTTVSGANGVATVTGGVNSGNNVYHRFSGFDTTQQQDNLSGVYFNIGNSGVQNLVVGVTAGPAKISVPLVLSSSANLIFMSPYGIQVSGNAAFGFGASTTAFAPLPRVSLSTANRLDFSNNTSNQSYFEAVTVSTPGGYPNGSPIMPTGLSASASSIGSIILDGQTSGPVTLQVDQALMVADLEYNANTNLSPVLVKGQVTLATASSGEIYGSFRLGEWGNNAWTAATLTADSGSGGMAWMAPVEVTPGSQFVLQGGAIDVSALVKLYGWNSTGSIAFASLVSTSGSNASSGGIDLYGPGRIAVTGGSLQIEGTPQIGVKANYPVGTNPYTFTTEPYGAATDAFNLFFDISDGAAATVDGAIVLGQGGVSKLGGGDLTFNSDANSYTGPTNVQGGYLQVNGSVPSTATCSNGGSSNLCLEDILETIGALQDDPLSDNEDGSVLDAGTVDTASEEEGGSFDIASGEGSISGEDLDVDVAVNDSFEVADADGGDDGAAAEADGADGAGDETASIDGADVDVDAGDGGSLASVTSVASEQASDGLSRSDGQSTRETVQSLAPELGGAMPPTPTPQQLQAEMQRQVQQIRSGAGGSPLANLIGPRADESGWMASTDLLAAGPLPPSFQRAAYQPAIVHIRFSEDRPAAAAGKPKLTDAFLDITLVPLEGPVEGRRVEISKKTFSEQLRQLYTSLSRQDSLDVTNAKAPARQLFNTLIGPIAPLLEARGVTTLLIAADRGLQAVPFAALHDGSRYFGDRYAFSITPSLALTNLNASGDPRGQTLLAAGASRFDGLAPLPLVPQELERVGGSVSKDLFLNRDFTPEVLLEKAGDPRYSRVHVATHAEFLPGGPAASYLYSGVGPIPLSTFTRLRQQRKGSPLDLISFSACRTALGDPSSELGFAGLAVQAGARSAAGTLWYVDDVATSAYFQQMYRYLGQGVPKAESLQLTRQAFLRGLVRLDGDRVLGPDGAVLLQNLTSVQQRRVRDGLQNPYFWGGVELVGAPW